MASLAYKCIRRAVNVFAFILLMVAVAIIVYPCIYTRALESLERQMNARFLTSSSFLYYNAMLSLFLAMLSSTSVNSKSKFTLKLAIIFGVFYCLIIGVILLYTQFSYKSSSMQMVLNSANSAEKMNILSSIVNMTTGNTLGVREPDTDIVKMALRLVSEELNVVVHFGIAAEVLGLLITILMILGINCKISTTKSTPTMRMSEGVTRSVGWSTPAQNLRQKLQAHGAPAS